MQATHPYSNEDEDELSFEAGEIIYVVPFDNPDEQARLSLLPLNGSLNQQHFLCKWKSIICKFSDD